MYMANARNLRLGLNTTYTTLTCVGVLRKVTQKICIIQCKKYQHVGIFVLGDAKVPNANGFGSQWNIGFTLFTYFKDTDFIQILHWMNTD